MGSRDGEDRLSSIFVRDRASNISIECLECIVVGVKLGDSESGTFSSELGMVVPCWDERLIESLP